MANIIKPRTSFNALDSARHSNGSAECNLIATAFNAAAVTCAEHFRSMGWRGHHINSLIGLSLSSTNVMRQLTGLDVEETVLSGLRYAERERGEWKDDLTDESDWASSRAMVSFLVNNGLDEVGVRVLEVPNDRTDQFESMLSVALMHGTLAMAIAKSRIYRSAPEQLEESMRLIMFEARSMNLANEDSKFASGLITLLARWISVSGSSKPMTLEDAWNMSRSIYNAKETNISVGEQAAPSVVKARRMKNGLTHAAETRNHFSSCADQLTRYLRQGAKTDKLTKRFAEDAGIAPLLVADTSQVFLSTCMTPEAYQSFVKDDRYRDVWDRGVSWHKRYSDQPLVVRATSEMKLFGERGDGIAYGYLTTSEGWQDDVSRAGRRGYGTTEVFWKPDILRYCTFTFEDSHSAEFTMDANNPSHLLTAALLCALFYPWDSIRGHHFLKTVAKGVESELPRRLAGRYLEFQCHKPLTSEDVESVIHHGNRL
jgi:hypothetical protein